VRQVAIASRGRVDELASGCQATLEQEERRSGALAVAVVHTATAVNHRPADALCSDAETVHVPGFLSSGGERERPGRGATKPKWSVSDGTCHQAGRRVAAISCQVRLPQAGQRAALGDSPSTL
jgi:hypothetical protein